MALDWDPADRSAFDEALIEQLAATFPEAAFGWAEEGRRLFITFPDGAVCTLWEPNFYFGFPSYGIAWLHWRAIESVAGQHHDLMKRL